MTSDTLLTPAEVAARLRLTVGGLKAARLAGNAPPSIKIGYRTVRYRASDVDAWLEQQQTTGD